MKNKFRIQWALLSLFVMASVLMSACKSKEPEIDIEAQKTGFAQTANVQASMTADARPTATITPSPTLTPTITSTPTSGTPTTTPTKATAGPTSIPINGNDVAAWRANDPPDNTVFKPKQEFTVTWTLENTGTSTWTQQYFIQFVSGEKMGADEKVYLPYNVPPGTNVQIAVKFIAPEAEGTKRSDWVLKNANENTFYTFYIVVEVSASGKAPVNPTATLTLTPSP